MLLCSLRGGVWQAIPKFLSFREIFCLNNSHVCLQMHLPLCNQNVLHCLHMEMHKYEMQFGKSLSFVICLSNCLIMFVCMQYMWQSLAEIKDYSATFKTQLMVLIEALWLPKTLCKCDQELFFLLLELLCPLSALNSRPYAHGNLNAP